MANVQKENGYTPIANELLEQMATIKLSPTQYRLIFIIWRYTYGFKRKQHDMSLTFLSKATGCDKRQIQRELKGLEDRKVICQSIKSGSYRKISFNKNYDSWIGKTDIGETTIGETTIGEIDNGETINTAIGEIVNVTIGETVNQEINKEKLKETNTVKSLLSKMESFNDLSGKAGVIVGFMNQKYPDRKRFGIKGNITANDVFTKYLKDGFSAERLLVAIDQSDEELSPWDAVEKSRIVVTESQLKAERLRDLWDTYHLGEDYYKEFGDINEYNQAVEELKHLGQL